MAASFSTWVLVVIALIALVGSVVGFSANDDKALHTGERDTTVGPQALVDAGSLLVQRGLPHEALERFNLAKSRLSGRSGGEQDQRLWASIEYWMGRAKYNLKDPEGAIVHYRASCAIHPTAVAFNNLGVAYEAMGQIEEAASAYEKAYNSLADTQYRHIFAFNLGRMRVKQNLMAEAIPLLFEACKGGVTEPRVWSALHLALGAISPSILAHVAAEAVLKNDVTRTDPGDCACPDDFNGNTTRDPRVTFLREVVSALFQDDEQMPLGLSLARFATRLAPCDARAWSMLSETALVLLRYDEAERAAAHGVELAPGLADVHCALGLAKYRLYLYNEAIEQLEMGLELGGCRLAVHDVENTIGLAHMNQHNVHQAIQAFKRARSAHPGAILPLVHYLFTKLSVCDWSNGEDEQNDALNHTSSWEKDLQDLRGVVERRLREGSIAPVVPYHATVFSLPIDQVKEITIRFAQSECARTARGEGGSLPSFAIAWTKRRPRLPLRVGFVSTDLLSHSVGKLIRGVFDYIDRSKIMTFGYAVTPDDHSYWRRSFAANMDHFVEIPFEERDMTLARRLNEDQLDILIDLNGHTALERRVGLLCTRIAPVQISFLGYAGTTGLPHVDYYLSDRIATPPEHASHFTEFLALLPPPLTYIPTDHRHLQVVYARSPGGGIHPATWEEAGLPPDPTEERVTLCAFNQFFKIDHDTFSSWMRILREHKHSILWFLRFPASNVAEANLKREAKQLGVDPDRLVFTEWASNMRNTAIKELCDLFLDTPRYNAHSSGVDVLWAMIPPVTLPGDRMAARVGASLAHAAGIDRECVASSLGHYEELARGLVSNVTHRTEIRAQLSDGRTASPLFDTQTWCRGFEQTLLLLAETRFMQCEKTYHVIAGGR